MRKDHSKWTRVWAPVGLALASLVCIVGTLAGRSAAGHTLPPSRRGGHVQPPTIQQERLWAEVGLNEAWYVANGFTEEPPSSIVGRPSSVVSPYLILDPQVITFTAFADQPALLTATVSVSNGGSGTLSWVATLAPGGAFTPTLVPTSGLQGEGFTLTVDSALYPSGTLAITYTRRITVSATPSDTWNSPQVLTASLYVVPHSIAFAVNLPLVLKSEPPPPTPDPVPPEVRALWITRYDWTSAYGPEGPADIDQIVANAASAGFNTLFFQVRAHGDAYYAPGLEPWSARLNDDGVLGRDPGWDPLARMVEQAHARGLEVHAYVNVYPAWLGTTAPPQEAAPEHVFWTWSHAYTWDDWRHWHQTTGVMPLNSSYLWASPGADGVRDHVVAVVGDIVARYAVDGVHLDLVRYASSAYSYDPLSNAAAGSAKTPAREQWQRDRVSDLVARIYATIQGVRSDVRLSAAVWFCYYADGCGYGLSSGYADYYQDSLGWLASGTMDAIAPMLYEWSGFDDLEVWRALMEQFQGANAGRHVYPGISGDYDDFGQISARIQAARDAGTAGHAIFSYGALDLHGYWDDFAAGPYAQPATLP